VDFIATSSPAIFLPSDVSSFLWGADGTLYYTESGPAGTKLVSSKAGKTPKTLFLDVVPDFRITGINQSGVMLVTAPSSQSNGIGELISSTGKGSVIFSGAGLAVLPSPKSTFLASALDSDGRLTNIGLFNAKGDLTRSFNVVTLPEKCAWVGTATSVYCAVPENISGSLPEDWFQGKVGFHDRIVKIATETGIISEVLPQTSFDVVDIFLDPQEQYLFFRNKSDSSLWRLELPK
jgi:hypothetical protein